jgi:hypothetical protein
MAAPPRLNNLQRVSATGMMLANDDDQRRSGFDRGAPVDRDEIRQSKMRLEELIGRPVSSFAYPEGLYSDFTHETAALVRDAGFACGCAATPGIVHHGTSAYRLPRLMVRDEDGDRFAERLSTYFLA